MRYLFGLLAIVLVLAIVGFAGKRQLSAVRGGAASAAAPAASRSGTPGAEPASAQADMAAIQRDVRDRTAEALRDGARRNDEADR